MIITNYNKRSKSEKEEIEKILSEEFDSMYNLKISDISLSSSRYDIMTTISRILLKLLSLMGMSDMKETYDKDSIIIPFANKLMMRQFISFKIIETKKIDRMKHYSYFGLLHNDKGISKIFYNWEDLKRMIEDSQNTENIFKLNRDLEAE